MGWQTRVFASHCLFIGLDKENDGIYVWNYLKVTVVSVLGLSGVKKDRDREEDNAGQ